jgi:hypothetical protein
MPSSQTIVVVIFASGVLRTLTTLNGGRCSTLVHFRGSNFSASNQTKYFCFNYFKLQSNKTAGQKVLPGTV